MVPRALAAGRALDLGRSAAPAADVPECGKPREVNRAVVRALAGEAERKIQTRRKPIAAGSPVGERGLVRDARVRRTAARNSKWSSCSRFLLPNCEGPTPGNPQSGGDGRPGRPYPASRQRPPPSSECRRHARTQPAVTPDRRERRPTESSIVTRASPRARRSGRQTPGESPRRGPRGRTAAYVANSR
jgi:hypothetical protein